jgi:putative salt-induced outer membrane protein YdiY
MLVAIVTAAMVLLPAQGAAAREKIDVVTLRGGDRITGEIRELTLGVLTVKTEHMGTVAIEWIGVQAISTTQLFEVTDIDGRRLYGSLGPSAEGNALEVSAGGVTVVLGHDQIARIAQIEDRWRDRWSGFVNLGAGFATANSQKDLTVDAGTTYRAESFQLQSALAGSASDRDDVPRTSRASLTTAYQRFMRGRWFWFSELLLARNEELDLRLRSSLVGGLGRYLVMTPRSQLFLAAGLSGVRENYAGDELGGWSSEAAFTGSYQLFVFEGRQTSLTTNLSVLPSLTVSGRYRIEFTSSLRRKLVRDFTVALTLEESYDSKPPEGARSSDLRFRTSLGWSF